MSPDEKIKAWNLIERLRTAEGNSVTLICDNPDFNGQPNCAIDVCGDWTAWLDRRFTGDTILEALQAAHEAMARYEERRLYGGDF